MRCVYHFCTLVPLPNGSSKYSSGAIELDAPIELNEHHESITALIAEHLSLAKDSFVIVSLSLLTPPRPQEDQQ